MTKPGSSATRWYSCNLGDGLLAWEPLQRIENAFEQLYQKSGEPEQLAIFKRHDMEGHLHCEVVVYFAPAAAELARKFGAQPCVKPVRDSLSLVAGNPQAWTLLFTAQD